MCILRFTFLLTAFEDLKIKSFTLLTCFLYEKHLCDFIQVFPEAATQRGGSGKKRFLKSRQNL